MTEQLEIFVFTFNSKSGIPTLKKKKPYIHSGKLFLFLHEDFLMAIIHPGLCSRCCHDVDEHNHTADNSGHRGPLS
jgi:hypothetical protein